LLLGLGAATGAGITLSARRLWSATLEQQYVARRLSAQLHRLHSEHHVRVEDCGKAGTDGDRVCRVRATAPTGRTIEFPYHWREGDRPDPEALSLAFLYSPNR